MNKNVKFIKPKKYHIVIRDITKYIEKMVKDPRDVDRSFLTDKIKETLEVMNFELLRSDKETDKKIVYMMGIQLISMLIVQSSLFGRICINNEFNLEDGVEELVTLPKGWVPMFFKHGTKNGKKYDYYHLHTLKTMKKWYDKELVNKSIEDLMNGR
jgi:hypothetical protein